MIYHIFKYPIPIIDGIIECKVPRNFRYCDIQVQDNKIYMWCLINNNEKIITIKLRVFGTGHKIDNPEDYEYLKTVQLDNGDLIFHVFEVIK